MQIREPLHAYDIPTGDEGQTFHNSNGRVVGRLEDGWLVKRGLDYSRHHLHKYRGWATDAAHIAELQAIRAKGIRLCLADGSTFESALGAWLAHGFTIHHDGQQIVLVDRFWRRHAPGVRQLALLEVG